MNIVKLGVIGITGICALGAGYTALQLFNKEPVIQRVEKVKEEEKLQVLVANTDIKMGNKVSGEMLRWQAWPKTAVTDVYITKKEDGDAIERLTGSIARAQIYKSEPIRQSKLVNAESGFMSAILPKGQRAVATSISSTTSAGGFILPNDRVDVLVTRRRDGEGSQTYTTEVILENIRVLAIDQEVEEKDGVSAVIGETATLQLNPEQVEELAVAQETAERISLSLRSIADSGDDAVARKKAKTPKRGNVKVIRYGNIETMDAAVSDRYE